jgi:hypothetical protein
MSLCVLTYASTLAFARGGSEKVSYTCILAPPINLQTKKFKALHKENHRDEQPENSEL